MRRQQRIVIINIMFHRDGVFLLQERSHSNALNVADVLHALRTLKFTCQCIVKISRTNVENVKKCSHDLVHSKNISGLIQVRGHSSATYVAESSTTGAILTTTCVSTPERNLSNVRYARRTFLARPLSGTT